MLKYCTALIFLGILTISSAELNTDNDLNQFLEIGDTLDISCSSEDTIVWSLDDTIIDTDNTLNITITVDGEVSTVTVDSVTGDHAGIWECDVGDSNLKIVVYVEAIITAPDSVELEIGSNLTLTCVFEDDTLDGGTYLTWSKNGVLIGTSSDTAEEGSDERISLIVDTLNIDVAVYGDAGTYTCSKTYACLDTTCDSDQDIVVYFGPEILNTGKSLTVPRDDTATLTCKVESYPKATVYWAINGTEIANTSRITATSEIDDDDVQIVTLEIKDLEDEDRNNYECIATTEFNEDFWTMLLRVKDPLAALWPFLGIVIEVIVLLIIIFIHERRRKGKEAEAEDEDDDVPVSKPVNSGPGEMRMRSVKGEDK